jgi:uncharacterized membrane protein YphA (DoxX/SURF4 family)
LSTLRVVLATLLLAINGATHYFWENITFMQPFSFCGRAVQFPILGNGAMALRLMADVLKHCSGLTLKSQKENEI